MRLLVKKNILSKIQKQLKIKMVMLLKKRWAMMNYVYLKSLFLDFLMFILKMAEMVRNGF